MRPLFTCRLLLLLLLSAGIANAQKLPPVAPAPPVPKPATRCVGLIRVFRLAVACTPQFAEAVAGKNPDRDVVLGGIKTIIDKVNELYKRELAIKFILVDDTDERKIIFTDPNNNPFRGTESDLDKMLSQSQQTIRAAIGIQKFDIGHTFFFIGDDHNAETGKGSTPAVRIDARKGMGCSGLSNFANLNPFVKTVAHEMGHQFGAHHTFNAETGSCGHGNRSPLANAEPGSGSTLMSYAGSCDDNQYTNNLQANEDTYFNSVSFFEINKHIDRVGAYLFEPTGASVAPTIRIQGPKKYIIPKSTPFVLTASGKDYGGNPVLFCWEQIDVGATAHNWNQPANDAQAPLFRSFPPTTDPFRYFPRLDDIIANKRKNYDQTTIGEWMPTYRRTMHFRVTGRNNKTGVCSDNLELEVSGISGPFSVTDPNDFTIWRIGEIKTVKWDVANTKDGPIYCKKVSIELSTDGGRTYLPIKLNSVTDNNGEAQTRPVPNTPTAEARVRVKAVNNVFFDISDNNFVILPPLGTYVFNCPTDITVQGESIKEKGKTKCVARNVTWPEPVPNQIEIPKGANLPKGNLTLLGTIEDDGGILHNYYKSDDSYAWPVASDIAKALGLVTGAKCHLVTINSEEENEFLLKKKNSGQPLWIGLRNQGQGFKWVTDEALDDVRWKDGEPNNGGVLPPPVLEPYAALNGEGEWEDLPEKDKHAFILEFEGLIVKTTKPVKIKIGGTLEKLKDPYEVCYDFSKLKGLFKVTPDKATCCFKLKIDCKPVKKITLHCPKDTTLFALANNGGQTCGFAFVHWDEPKDSGIVYQQISGIANHSYQPVGNYTITYIGVDTTLPPDDTTLSRSDTCSFTVTVQCSLQPPTTLHCPYDTTFYAVPIDTSHTCNMARAYVTWQEPRDSGIFYQQISGVPNGSYLPVGSYPVCYQAFRAVHDSMPQKLDTCCFTITVLCQSQTTALPVMTSRSGKAKAIDMSTEQSLRAQAYPNPSHHDFSIRVNSYHNDKVTIIVSDALGRVIEVKRGLSPDSVVSIGRQYPVGVYVLQVLQGSEHLFLKLLKQGQ
jgi:predicted Zn-dependent protease